jgi:hypothetical protein
MDEGFSCFFLAKQRGKNMSIYNLKFHIDHSIEHMPDWITFAFGLGAFLYEEGCKYGHHAHILVILPSELYFALFTAVGIADRKYSVRRQMRSIIKQVMTLKPNSRIIYHSGGVPREVSVLSIEPSPINSEEMLLYVQDGSVKTGIPERKWFESITMLDEELVSIKRTRKVKKTMNIGIQSELLRTIYSEAQLNKVSFYPGDYFYLVGDKVQIESMIREPFLDADGVVGSLSDFLYVENLTKSGSYTNGKFFSTHQKNSPVNIDQKVPVLYSDAMSYRKQRRNFPKNPSLIAVGRTDQQHRIYELTSHLVSEIIQNNYHIIKEEVADYLKEYGAPIPRGIEMLAWRER